MITIEKLEFRNEFRCKFNAVVNGVRVASGVVSFTSYSEMKQAEKSVSIAVANEFGCDPSRVCVCLHIIEK